jgi:ribosome-associated toxin RatA of RatAB toxin-antitoxin module
MSQVQQSQVINAAIAPTWAAISSMRAVQDWHPNVAHAEVLTPNDSGVGASRRVEFQDGRSEVETVTEESELRFTKMEMTASSPLNRALITIRTKERSADTTEVTFSIDYGLKYGPIGWVIDAVMMKRLFGKVFNTALGGLSYHLETGKLVTDSIPDRVGEPA